MNADVMIKKRIVAIAAASLLTMVSAADEIAVPLTPAPLFVVAHDAEGLLKIFEEAR